MPSNIQKKLKMVKPEKLTQNEKNVLWAKIEENIEPGLSIIFGLSPKFIFAAFSIVALIGGSAATVAASDNAKPGDILYSIDIAAEKIQLVFSTSKKKDDLRIKFAKERIKEVKIVLSFSDSDDSDSIGVFSDQNTTSSLPGGSTSTDQQDATSTPPEEETEDDGDDDKEKKQFKFEKAEAALTIALSQLEETKKKLEEKGNSIAVAAINQIILELTGLAESHIAELEKFKAKVKTGKDDRLKIEIKASTENLKIKFKLEEKKDKKGKEKSEIIIMNNGSKRKIKIKDSGFKLTYSVKGLPEEDEGGDGDNGTSTPDTTAPVISNVTPTTTTSTAEIGWNTDELSDSIVWYGTTTPLIISTTTQSVISINMVTSHALSLPNLSPGTTYYFIVNSTDNDGNSTSSAEHSFTTLTEDTTPPVISAVTATSTTATSTTIAWSTDEVSDSKVWYSTTTPLVISTTTPAVSSSSLVTNHTLSLSNLSASTTYYFIAGSNDTVGNSSTSTESSFTTLP
ncbi:MAG: hypothetical protein KJI71_03655 [Patescibacteria group bacterium]|nr:hypothetical protein [Patescibacteria group bacterium]